LQILLAQDDSDWFDPKSGSPIGLQLNTCLEVLWHTDLIRPWRPTVLQEVARGLAFVPVLWEEAPEIVQDLRRALVEYYPGVHLSSAPLIRFGSWIGGDRDGNPYVTPQVTEQTFELLRQAAIDRHRAECFRLSEMLSISDRQSAAFGPLVEAIRHACGHHPELADVIAAQPPSETYRKWLKVIAWRLERTAAVPLATSAHSAPTVGAYSSAADLSADVELMARGLAAGGCLSALESMVQPW
jgi:phosphoenolpyruvate carboxylase